ncbi:MULTISPECIES: HNH endonuclease [unclassified Kitasatospora]|uniref:HNH endonuclease n=1 Tax=unclassified Kitasatospora TaxID=2633591 RepID=UPI0007C8536A|nr:MULTISPECIES: HNH endonuclease [unclassified Kitasatospora]
MIPLQRPPLTDQLEAELARRTEAIRKAGPTTATGRAAWRTAREPKARLRTLLHRMTPGLLRCMYCGDNLGTDIDHFEPIARAPLRTFDWHNHLLACAYCNSNQKRDRFPTDPASGTPLLIDPATEDPADHLLLYLESGAYQGLTAKGHATIDVFALNSRAELVRGRRLAFTVVKALLRDWHTRTTAGDHATAAEIADALDLLWQADVVRAVYRLTDNRPLAEVVLGPEAFTALTALT